MVKEKKDDCLEGDDSGLGPSQASNTSVPGSFKIAVPEGFDEKWRKILNSVRPPVDSRWAIWDSADALLSVYTPIAETIEAFQSYFLETIAPLVADLSKRYADIDWEKVANGSRQWGKYGWIPPDRMSLAQISNPPKTRLEADKIALSMIKKDDVAVLRGRLMQEVPKKRDMQEALELFDEGRYKPAAMMICSLIECELFKSLGRANYRKSKQAIERLRSEAPKEGLALVSVAALVDAYDYFFSRADNFNHDVEGELNRHFLQHGMMYNPVRRKTCIKLFLLLLAVTFWTRVQR